MPRYVAYRGGSCELYLGPGSIAPSALVLEALKCYEERSHEADKNIRTMRSQLPQAVGDLLKAALCEFDPTVQMRLCKVCVCRHMSSC